MIEGLCFPLLPPNHHSRIFLFQADYKAMGFFTRKKSNETVVETRDEKKDGAVVEVDEVAEETGLSKVGLIFGEFVSPSAGPR